MTKKKAPNLAEVLREKFLDEVENKIECDTIVIGGHEFEYCWRPMTGAQQREIQRFANKSIAEGICAHIKVRAIDREGNKIFENVPMSSMMNDYNFKDDLLPMFERMAGADIAFEDLEKN